MTNCLFHSTCNVFIDIAYGLLQDVSERKIRFTSDHSPKELLEKIVDIVTEMGLQVQKGHGKVGTSRSPAIAWYLGITTNCSFVIYWQLKVTQKQDRRSTKSAASLSLATEVKLSCCLSFRVNEIRL